MKDPIRVGRARQRLWLALGFAVTAAVVVAFAWPASEPVKLLHVGFADHGDRGISPVLCLTNGGTKAIIYSDDSGATASFRYSVQSDSGWSGPYTNRGGFGMAPRRDVLKPGESVQFEFNRPLGPRGWRIGIAYYSCETVQPMTQPSRVPIRVASAASFFTMSNFLSSIQYRETAVRMKYDRKRSFLYRLATRLPKSTPAWVKQSLQRQHRDPVAWGPPME